MPLSSQGAGEMEKEKQSQLYIQEIISLKIRLALYASCEDKKREEITKLKKQLNEVQNDR